MKLRHAAALALVGWYLLVPPLSRDDVPQNYLPLAQWRLIASYDTAAECMAGSDGYLSGVKKGIARYKTNLQTAEALIRAAREAQCIATDDPRLKGT